VRVEFELDFSIPLLVEITWRQHLYHQLWGYNQMPSVIDVIGQAR
jgi:hypothetical protein